MSALVYGLLELQAYIIAVDDIWEETDTNTIKHPPVRSPPQPSTPLIVYTKGPLFIHYILSMLSL